jgi:hypothetical protein
MRKSNKNTMDFTIDYFSKLSDREERLKDLVTYYEDQISGSITKDGEYDRVCKIAIANILPELNHIKVIKESVLTLNKKYWEHKGLTPNLGGFKI